MAGWRIQISGLDPPRSDSELEKSPLLKNVVSRGAFYKDQQTGKEVFNFEAKLEK
jgi:hypothetical protein